MVLEPSLNVLESIYIYIVCVCVTLLPVYVNMCEGVIYVCVYMSVLENAYVCDVHEVCVSDMFMSLHACV